jgi:hypothetical protein
VIPSVRLACQGALPLLAHSLFFGVHARGAEADAQAAGLSLLLRLVEQHGVVVLEPLQAQGALYALVQLVMQKPSPRVLMLAARLICAPIGHMPTGLAPQWGHWMTVRGMAALRQAICSMEPDDLLFSFLACLLLNVSEDAIDGLPEPRFHCYQARQSWDGWGRLLWAERAWTRSRLLVEGDGVLVGTVGTSAALLTGSSCSLCGLRKGADSPAAEAIGTIVALAAFLSG